MAELLPALGSGEREGAGKIPVMGGVLNARDQLEADLGAARAAGRKKLTGKHDDVVVGTVSKVYRPIHSGKFRLFSRSLHTAGRPQLSADSP